MTNSQIVYAALSLIAAAILMAALSITIGSVALADRDGGDPTSLAQNAIDPDPVIAEPAIVALRAMGPSGLNALRRAHRDDIEALRQGSTPGPSIPRLRHAIDRVSGQRDGHASGLYWYTDLDQARAEARRTGRPILSLRLLGRLDEELSCANSRFFRVVLYAHDEVSEALRRDFILHWSSERPAPHIIIDMGDGRRIERTLTGNSIHYVLDSEGRVIDAIPGLYAPQQFLRALENARSVVTACSGTEDVDRCVAERHRSAATEVARSWEERQDRPADLTFASLLALSQNNATTDAAEAPPSAFDAMPLTIGKASMEMPMLRAIGRPRIARTTLVDWRAYAAQARSRESFDAVALALLRLKLNQQEVSEAAARLIAIASADGERNEITMHSRIHNWLSDQGTPRDLETFNQRIYTELFATPRSDPWLGLSSEEFWDVIEPTDR